MKKSTLLVAVYVFAVQLITSANAATVFNYNGTCATNCSNIGLIIGDSVSGYFEIADLAATPNNQLEVANFLSFGFSFGSSTPSSGNEYLLLIGDVFINGAGTGITGTGIIQFRLATNEYVGGIFASDSSWFYAPPPDFNSASGSGTLSVVPVPAAVWLFGSGLVGLIGFARRSL